MKNDKHLEKCLAFTVPIWINEYKNKPTDWLMRRKDNYPVPKEWRRKGPNTRSIASIIGERGDNLLYGSKRTGEAAFLFNALAEGIAILAIICKGGVTFGNLSWEYDNGEIKIKTNQMDSGTGQSDKEPSSQGPNE